MELYFLFLFPDSLSFNPLLNHIHQISSPPLATKTSPLRSPPSTSPYWSASSSATTSTPHPPHMRHLRCHLPNPRCVNLKPLVLDTLAASSTTASTSMTSSSSAAPSPENPKQPPYFLGLDLDSFAYRVFVRRPVEKTTLVHLKSQKTFVKYPLAKPVHHQLRNAF